MAFHIVRQFLKLEAASGIILFFAAIFALIVTNSPFASYYYFLLNTPIEIHLGSFMVGKSLLFWINDGLMTLFFLLVGLELKREFITGELAGAGKIILPGVAALGGMLVPAIFYILVNYHNTEALRGWAIPVATDIAFALGVLSLFGRRVPLGLKLFLMTLAIFDDLGAIVIIALFHSHSLSYLSLGLSFLSIAVLFCMNYWGVRQLFPYLLVGFILWVCVLNSGVHATLAGVLLAFLIPLQPENNSPARTLENLLHPWVAYLVLPLFALANAGLSLTDVTPEIMSGYVTLGVVLGLFFGKQIGVFVFTVILVRTGWAKLPEQVGWLEIYGMALLCGIGFTMSLFLGTLAFEYHDPVYLTEVRLGVLSGSVLSGMMGAGILYWAFRNKSKKRKRI